MLLHGFSAFLAITGRLCTSLWRLLVVSVQIGGRGGIDVHLFIFEWVFIFGFYCHGRMNAGNFFGKLLRPAAVVTHGRLRRGFLSCGRFSESRKGLRGPLRRWVDTQF